ncbi:MAG: MBOAT family O-acyltransferase [Phycisphaerales bacterium]
MLFNSIEFLLFFTTVVAVHYLVRSWSVNKVFLLLVSYYFYASWNPPFVILLWISTVADWHLGKAIDRAEQPRRRRLLVIVSLAINLGLLGYFKYATFLLESFYGILGLFHVPAAPPRFNIILPVGISFYTFQTLSYTLDIYRRRAKPWHSFLDYTLYVTFFPQLVAGPIVRAADFLPQCDTPKRATANQFGWGLMLMVIGLFEKAAIADGLLAPLVERVYDSPAAPNFASAWTGTLAFAGQIFCDFSGYSNCAIGAALCLGFWLPKNFNCPYASVGFSDFWRRWHMSLSTWLRDYLYIPLGGNRSGPTRTLANLAITMLLGGLWHGASWTFVVWGGLHGLYLIVERLIAAALPKPLLQRLKPLQFAYVLLTFVLVCFAWVFFRADTFHKAFVTTMAMLGNVSASSVSLVAILDNMIVATVIAGILGFHWIMRNRNLEQVVAACPWWVRSAAMAGMVIAVITLLGEDRAFIYFQF